MDISLKKDLQAKLESITPEYGMAELTFPSFARCCGYRAQPLSAADAAEAVSALLDAGVGVRVDIEVEGARNGGEWFGGSRAWSLGKGRDDERENVPPGGVGKVGASAGKTGDMEVEDMEGKKGQEWKQCFWFAFDSLNEYVLFGHTLPCSTVN
jgi:cell division control protein 45